LIDELIKDKGLLEKQIQQYQLLLNQKIKEDFEKNKPKEKENGMQG
jgi:hypothetical protein